MGISSWFKNLFRSEPDRPESLPREKTAAPPRPKFHVPTIKANMLVAEATRWVGIRESGGNNSGQMVRKFQEAVDGKAVGEPWCLSFAQFCIIAVEDLSFAMGIRELRQSPGHVYPTEHCLTLWNNTPEEHRSKNPVRGGLVIWQYMNKDGKGTSSGHVGIVTRTNADGTFDTIEGNTSVSGTNVNREGDGVAEKNRSPRGAGRMKVKGFIRIWV